MTRSISSSLIIKFVALVSSSIRKSLLPASSASIVFAACEVEPLASSVEKFFVSFPLGRFLIKRLISSFLTLRPSSARSFTPVASVTIYSLPSPAICGYTLFSSV